MALSKRKTTKHLTRRGTQTGGDPTVYRGAAPGGNRYRNGLYLIAVDDAPDHPAFPKMGKGKVPPETFYVYDPKLRRVSHMLSVDADGIGTAWDMDYSGKYFTRVQFGKAGTRREVWAPRFVEYAYDSARVLSEGGHWSHSHPDYRGSLGSRRVHQEPSTDVRLPRRGARPSAGLSGGKTTVPRQGGKPLRKGGAVTTPAQPRKTLTRSKPVEQSTLLSDKGLDTQGLDAAAAQSMDAIGAAFGKKSLKRRK